MSGEDWFNKAVPEQRKFKPYPHQDKPGTENEVEESHDVSQTGSAQSSDNSDAMKQQALANSETTRSANVEGLLPITESDMNLIRNHVRQHIEAYKNAFRNGDATELAQATLDLIRPLYAMQLEKGSSKEFALQFLLEERGRLFEASSDFLDMVQAVPDLYKDRELNPAEETALNESRMKTDLENIVNNQIRGKIPSQEAMSPEQQSRIRGIAKEQTPVFIRLLDFLKTNTHKANTELAMMKYLGKHLLEAMMPPGHEFDSQDDTSRANPYGETFN